MSIETEAKKTRKPRKTREKPVGRLISQKGIQDEFGIKSGDVIRWCMAGTSGFPRPVKIISRVYWFERSAIHRYFGLKDLSPPPG